MKRPPVLNNYFLYWEINIRMTANWSELARIRFAFDLDVPLYGESIA